ncbi:MAG: macro domain-containing protein [Gammaproteobacteria bacterium]|nr:macro domain-containing protein [Acholeplasmataceae bacterium]MCK9529173.1 macro domain-containing protein [Gammaproteobacteria bacterium]
MTVKYVKGNLINLAMMGEFDVIVHGCNCFNKMGNGLAKDIKKYFPEAYEADKRTFAGDRSKLGTFSSAKVTNALGEPFYVVNAYTQFTYNSSRRVVEDLFEYDAFVTFLQSINTYFDCLKIGFPLIGAGLAGGNWERIKQLIEEHLSGQDVTIVELP